MNHNDLISVIIPVYNMENYLSRCLDSVCRNTYKNLEIICINDGSTDSSLKILEQYKKNDDRIIIVDQNNRKLSAARNAGIEIAKGEWIAFIDSDDWIHPRYFEILLYIAKEENIDICIGGQKIVSSICEDEKLPSVEEIKYRIITKSQLNQYHIARSRVWGKIYKRTVIGNFRFISGAEPEEDKVFNTTLYSERMKYCIVDCPLYYYYMREDSAVHKNTGRQSLAYTKVMIPILDKETDPEKKQDMIQRCYKTLLSARYLEMYAEDYPIINKEINEDFFKLRKYRNYLSNRKRIIYTVLSHSPTLYRWWRILDDPTLLDYEKKMKKKRHHQ